jgi:hypothetical protein
MTEQTESPRIDGRSREARMAREAERIAANASNVEADRARLDAAETYVEGPDGKRITRDNRRGFGNQSQKLAYPPRIGYHRHHFNDTPGRIVGALKAGWTHVNDPETGKPIENVVGVAATGGGLKAFLMEIPEEWWKDDMAEIEKINAAKEETIKRGVKPSNQADANNFYDTAQGRHLQVTRR